MRLQYHEDKRRVFTKQVEDTLRSGVIEDVRQEFPTVKQPTAMNRTAGSTGRPTQLFGAATTTPRTVLSKHAMNFVHDYGLDMP